MPFLLSVFKFSARLSPNSLHLAWWVPQQFTSQNAYNFTPVCATLPSILATGLQIIIGLWHFLLEILIFLCNLLDYCLVLSAMNQQSVGMPTSGYLSLLVNLEGSEEQGLPPAVKYFEQIKFRSCLDLQQDVVAYRNYMAKSGPEVSVSDSAKCNLKAKQLRLRAKSLFQQNNCPEALDLYGASVCWAELSTSAVGSGYAGRAAVYHRLGEFEYSLINIKLAKENGYPERFWPTVDRYEQDCKAKLQKGHSKSVGVVPMLGLNVEPNASIPFLAKGVHTVQIPDCGRGLVAERDFTSGDVILHEKPMLAAVQFGVDHRNCSFCTTPIMPQLVPCPGCATAVYCGRRCLEEDNKCLHRYECGIMEKLQHISFRSFPLGPKMFFYGLGLFNGDLDQFMKFCKANPRTGSDPIKLDYTNLNKLDEFKAFHCAKEPPAGFEFEFFSKFIAALYFLIYMKQPRVASLLRTKDQQDFFLTQTLDYMRMASILNIGQPAPYNKYTTQHFSIASLCNHACYPNTMALYHAGHLKFVVIRPIAKGQQITIPYVPPWEEFRHRTDQLKALSQTSNLSTCVCDACDPVKALALKMAQIIRGGESGSCLNNESMATIVRDGDIQGEELRKFCEQHLTEVPSEYIDFQELTNSYRMTLGMAFIKEVDAEVRNKQA